MLMLNDGTGSSVVNASDGDFNVDASFTADIDFDVVSYSSCNFKLYADHYSHFKQLCLQLINLGSGI